MPATITLFTDGAFAFGSPRPAYGWVAVGENGKRPVATGSGQIPNDGSNNFAGEAAAAIAALEFAVTQGARVVHLCTDLATLGDHLMGRFPNCRRKSAALLREFLSAHPDLQVVVTKVPSKHPFLEKAHHLARSAVAA